jgi:DNA-binding transcriptional regulator YdaS (Cro superfamily)
MKTETAIHLAGNKNRLAKLLGISRAAITQWTENVPKRQVEKLKILKPEWFTQTIV